MKMLKLAKTSKDKEENTSKVHKMIISTAWSCVLKPKNTEMTS